MLAAVAAIAVFGALAMTVLAGVQASLVGTQAELERGRADAAADAGATMAIHHLIASDPARRWSLDGRTRDERFAGNRLRIRIEDQRGKVPLIALTDEQVRRLFEQLGARGERLDTLVDSYLDWVDDDEDARPHGAELAWYARQGIHPRNAIPQSFGEFALIRGFDSAMIAKLSSVATLHFGNGPFDGRHATPLAIAVLRDDGEDSPEGIDRERELAGDRPAIDLATEDLAGRIVEIKVEAASPGGGRSRLSELVELTGQREHPYTVLDYQRL